MILRRSFILLLIFILTYSCRKDEYEINTPKNTIQYSFFVAGHTYGNPVNFQYGLHPPFVKTTPFLSHYPDLKLGVLTGDVVPFSTIDYWDSARVDINKFEIPIHIAAGNHDRGPVFDSLYTPNYSFRSHNDLFIILSTEHWNIDDDQKVFFENTIRENYKTVRHIFIFTHELIWWSPTNKFGNITINYLLNYPGSSNYWEDIFPILDTLNNDVTLFAGDLGATPSSTPFLYHKDKNITYLAGGMGTNKKDNIIIVNVFENGDLKYRLFEINNKIPHEYKNFEEFILP